MVTVSYQNCINSWCVDHCIGFLSLWQSKITLYIWSNAHKVLKDIDGSVELYVDCLTVESYCCSVLGCQHHFVGDCSDSGYQGNQSCIRDDEEVRWRLDQLLSTCWNDVHAMQNQDSQICKSRISISSKLKLYNTCILPSHYCDPSLPD